MAARRTRWARITSIVLRLEPPDATIIQPGITLKGVKEWRGRLVTTWDWKATTLVRGDRKPDWCTGTLFSSYSSATNQKILLVVYRKFDLYVITLGTGSPVWDNHFVPV